jgi:hypothetical protein
MSIADCRQCTVLQFEGWTYDLKPFTVLCVVILIYLSIYGSTVLFVGPWPLFSVS